MRDNDRSFDRSFFTRCLEHGRSQIDDLPMMVERAWSGMRDGVWIGCAIWLTIFSSSHRALWKLVDADDAECR